MTKKSLISTVANPVENEEEKKNPIVAEKVLNTINFKLGKFDDENRTFTAVASTELVDRQGDSIEQSGWVLDNFINNPVIPWGHDYSGLPVARAIEVGVVNGVLQFTYQATPEGVYPFADTVWNLYRNQYLFAFSVGFIPLEYDGNWDDGYTYTKCELLEISAVIVPANPQALALAVKAGDIDAKQAKLLKSKLQESLTNLDEILDMTKKLEEEQEGKSQPLTKEDINETVKEAIAEALKDFPITEKGASSVSLPINSDKTADWDGSGAKKRLLAWAGGADDKSKTNWSKYKKAFLWVDTANADTVGAYKYPIADVVGGSPKVIWKGVVAAHAAINGARGGGSGLSDSDKSSMLATLKKFYAKFDEEWPENDGKSLTDNEDDIHNENMTKTKSSVTLPAEVQDKLGPVILSMQDTADIMKDHAQVYIQKADLLMGHAETLKSLISTVGDETTDARENEKHSGDDADGDGIPDGVDDNDTGKSLTNSKTKSEEAEDETKADDSGEVNSTDEGQDEGADQEEVVEDKEEVVDDSKEESEDESSEDEESEEEQVDEEEAEENVDEEVDPDNLTEDQAKAILDAVNEVIANESKETE